VTTAAVLSLLAALMFGAGTALQAHAAYDVRPHAVVHLASLARMTSRPLWLAGTALDLLGALTHIAALHFGPLTLVQPLTLSAVVFAAPAQFLFRRRRPTWGQVAAAVETAAGLALVSVFLGRDLRTGHATATTYAGGLAVALLAVGGSVLVARQSHSRRTQALLLGTAAGSAYGLSDALARTVQVQAATRLGSPGWLLEVALALVVGGVGLLLTQAALQRDRLTSSLPAQDLFALVVGIGMGAALLGEVPLLSVPVVIGTAAALALVVHGTRVLSAPPAPALSW